MNLRCSFCQTPFTIGRIEKLAALQHLEIENLTHYDAHCPRCRRATPVLREQLEKSFPNWRDALHELEQQADAVPASVPQPTPASTSKAQAKPAHTHSKHRSRSGAKAKAAAAKPKATPAAKGKKKST